MGGKVLHNGARALNAKIAMRRSVLEHVAPAHVFDAFCGPDGEMWREVWRDAAGYVGCDEVYVPFDPRHRFVGDNRRIMRAIDLQAFNVFDLDAFGDPWEQLTILGARRRWSAAERGALLLTWNDVHTRIGGASHALAQAAGLKDRKSRGSDAEQVITPMAVRRFLRTSRVKPLRFWKAYGISSEGGSTHMSYWAIVFDGIGEAK